MKKPNIILVHAAFADSSSWNKVRSLLEPAGYAVIVPELPLASLSDDVAVLKTVITQAERAVVLAAHSYAAAVITAGSAGEDKVEALVYIAAMAPAGGETVADLLHRAPPYPKAPQLAPDDNGFIAMSVDGFTNALAPDSTPDEICEMVRTQRPISVKATTQPMSEPGWRQKPSWFLLAENDRVIAADTQRFFVARMGATVKSLPLDHMPLSSAPDEVAAIIRQAAQQAEGDQPRAERG